jgi:hypothetical protein
MARLSLSGVPDPGTGCENVALKNAFSALLLLKDGYSLSIVKKVFEEYGVELNAALNGPELAQRLRHNRFDLAVVDNDLLTAHWPLPVDLPTRWNGIALVLRGKEQLALQDRRVNLVIPKPITADLLSRSIKAVYTTMARRRIANYRHPVMLRLLYVRLLDHGMPRPLDRAMVLNLSQTGLCLSASQNLHPGAVVSAKIPLPDSKESLDISGTVMWSDLSGRTGLQFHRLSEFERKKLEDHLNSRLPWKLDSLTSPE